jgi:hypothetical protein
MAMNTTLSELDLRLDPWEVEYGSELPLGLPREACEETADAGVELPPAQWRPLTPEAAPDRPGRIVFVDGVRRIEARVLARAGAGLCHGAFGSYGVGYAEVAEGRAVIGDAIVERLLVLDSGASLPGPVNVDPGLSYQVVSVAAADADAPLVRIQEEMRRAEERLARAEADRPHTLVVADGPLTFGETVRGTAVGYVKRLFQLYVDNALLPVLAALPPGARSPLFALRTPQRFARYAWFLRLAAPRAMDSQLAGIVRLEVSDSVGLEAARRLADATATLLPSFAPSWGRDPRAPQNLLPIGALESALRRRLGDPRLVRRRITSALARGARAGKVHEVAHA